MRHVARTKRALDVAELGERALEAFDRQLVGA
jgi:hypothetical protein